MEHITTNVAAATMMTFSTLVDKGSYLETQPEIAP